MCRELKQIIEFLQSIYPRNYFEKVIRTRANRLSPILDELTVEQFRTIELVDLEKAKEMKSGNW